MKSRNVKWLTVIGGIVLLAGGLLADDGSAAQAGAKDNHALRWDTNNPSASRFVTAFTGAVLDQNTGLVWEQAPDGGSRPWGQATFDCVNKTVGGTVGWRLPSVVELKSVQDPTLAPPFVPASASTISTSNAIPGVQSSGYWSASTAAGAPDVAWSVFFSDGAVGPNGKGVSLYAWCVRGDMNADTY